MPGARSKQPTHLFAGNRRYPWRTCRTCTSITPHTSSRTAAASWIRFCDSKRRVTARVSVKQARASAKIDIARANLVRARDQLRERVPDRVVRQPKKLRSRVDTRRGGRIPLGIPLWPYHSVGHMPAHTAQHQHPQVGVLIYLWPVAFRPGIGGCRVPPLQTRHAAPGSRNGCVHRSCLETETLIYICLGVDAFIRAWGVKRGTTFQRIQAGSPPR